VHKYYNDDNVDGDMASAKIWHGPNVF